MRLRLFACVLLLGLLTTGCGSFFAHRMVQAPNTYPTWLAPMARVELSFDEKYITNFPAHFLQVGPPAAQLRYRVIEPADYSFVAVAIHGVVAVVSNAVFFSPRSSCNALATTSSEERDMPNVAASGVRCPVSPK